MTVKEQCLKIIDEFIQGVNTPSKLIDDCIKNYLTYVYKAIEEDVEEPHIPGLVTNPYTRDEIHKLMSQERTDEVERGIQRLKDTFEYKDTPHRYQIIEGEGVVN